MTKYVKLDQRLQYLLDLILKWTPKHGLHLDIGSDHGGLLQHLCRSGHITQGIAVEKREPPFRNSQNALASLPVDVRLGDGLDPIEPGEAQSMSISGMGGISIVNILSRFPDRVTPQVFLQPNTNIELVRQWALEANYHLAEERITRDRYVLLALQQATSPDPIYRSLPLEAALQFGPHLLLSKNETLHQRLIKERSFFERMPKRTEATENRLRLIELVLEQIFSE